MSKGQQNPGVISANEAYTLDELKRRLGFEDRAWWQLRDRGLKFTRVGRGLVILGSDVLKILGELAECHASESKSSTSAGTN